MTQRLDIVGLTSTSTYGFTYDKLNRLTLETLPGSRTNAYTYDAASNLKTVTDAGGAVTYTYDNINRQSSIQEPGVASPISFAYTDTGPDADPLTVDGGQRNTISLPNGVVTTNVLDAAGRLLDTASKTSGGTVLQRFSYMYAINGVMGALAAQEKDKDGATTNYGYDTARAGDQRGQQRGRRLRVHLRRGVEHHHQVGQRRHAREVRLQRRQSALLAADDRGQRPVHVLAAARRSDRLHLRRRRQPAHERGRHADRGLQPPAADVDPRGHRLRLRRSGPGTADLVRLDAGREQRPRRRVAYDRTGRGLPDPRRGRDAVLPAPDSRHGAEPPLLLPQRSPRVDAHAARRDRRGGSPVQLPSRTARTSSCRATGSSAPASGGWARRPASTGCTASASAGTTRRRSGGPSRIRCARPGTSVQANRYAYVGGNPVNSVDLSGRSIFNSPFAKHVKRFVTSPFARDVGLASRASGVGTLVCYTVRSARDTDDGLGDSVHDVYECSFLGIIDDTLSD